MNQTLTTTLSTHTQSYKTSYISLYYMYSMYSGVNHVKDMRALHEFIQVFSCILYSRKSHRDVAFLKYLLDFVRNETQKQRCT